MNEKITHHSIGLTKLFNQSEVVLLSKLEKKKARLKKNCPQIGSVLAVDSLFLLSFFFNLKTENQTPTFHFYFN